MSFDSESSRGGPSIVAEEAANPYLRAVRRHWRLVVLVALVAVAAAAFTVSRRGHSYQATATVLVSPLSTTNENLIGIGAIVDSGDPARNVETAGALIDSPAAAVAAAAALGRGWSQQRVQTGIAVQPLGQSNVVAVTATAPQPNDAKNLANAFTTASLAHRASVVQANIGAELGQLRGRLAGVPPASALATDLSARIDALQSLQGTGRDPTLVLASSAQRPTSPTGAPNWLIVMLALVGGVALGCIAALLMERFSGRVRDETEVGNLVRAPILTGIPKLRRGQARDAVSPDLMPPEVFEQFRLLRAQLGRRKGPAAVMVTSADAGDGKTTIAAGLAAAVAEIEQEVVLLDLDLAKPDASNVFGIKQKVDDKTLTNWSVKLDDMLVTAPRHPHLRVLPTQQTDLVTFEAVIDRFPHLLAEAKQTAQWVIIDSPPLTAVSSGIRLVQVCDEVLFVVRPHHTDRSRLILARDLLERVGAFVVGTVLVGQTIARVRPEYGYGWTDGAGARPQGRVRRWRAERATRASTRT